VKALTRPVAGDAEAFQLHDDRAAGRVAPLPGALDERPRVRASGDRCLLRRAAARRRFCVAIPAWSVPGTQRTLSPIIPSPAAEHVLQRVVEGRAPCAASRLMFGGGITIENGVPGASGSARKSSRCSHSSYQRRSTRCGSYTLSSGTNARYHATFGLSKAIAARRRVRTRWRRRVGAVLIATAPAGVARSRSRRLCDTSGPAPGARRHLLARAHDIEGLARKSTAGARVASFVLTHTIETVANGKITREHCNTCRGQHAYRAAAPGTKATSARPGAKSSARPRTSGRGVDAARTPRRRRRANTLPCSAVARPRRRIHT